MYNYFKGLKKYIFVIVVFGLTYSCVIGFSLFGPLLKTHQGSYHFAYSLISLLAFILALVIRYRVISNHKITYSVLMASFIILCYGYYSRIIGLEVASIFTYSFIIAALSKEWTFHVITRLPEKDAPIVISGAFIVAFTILYILNVTTTMLSTYFAFFIAWGILAIAYFIFNQQKMKVNVIKNDCNNSQFSFFRVGLFLTIVYIAGGISYAGIYPFLDAYAAINRFYNVLPLIVSLPLAGYVSVRYGRMHTYIIGTCFIGLAFSFFILGLNTGRFFAVQTALQIGWAYINVFGFTLAWQEGSKAKRHSAFGILIAFILLGVMTGAVIAGLFNAWSFSIQTYAVATLIPLFICMVYYMFTFESMKSVRHDMTMIFFTNLSVNASLTDRECEVAYYYYHDETATEIADRLNISVNTVKSHLKKIYLKLEVSSKKEFKQKIVSCV